MFGTAFKHWLLSTINSFFTLKRACKVLTFSAGQSKSALCDYEVLQLLHHQIINQRDVKVAKTSSRSGGVNRCVEKKTLSILSTIQFHSISVKSHRAKNRCPWHYFDTLYKFFIVYVFVSSNAPIEILHCAFKKAKKNQPALTVGHNFLSLPTDALSMGV